MRTYPHKIDKELIGEHRASARDLLDRLERTRTQAEADRNPLFFQIFGEQLRSLGVCDYAFEEPNAQVIEQLRQANNCFTKAIGFGLIMDPYEYIEYLSLALVLADMKWARHLAAFPRSRYLHPDVDSGEIIHLLAESLGLLVLDARELPDHVAAARQELASKNVTSYDRGIAESLIGIIEAMIARDQPAFDQAVANRQRDFKQARRFSGRNTPEALLDLLGLALVRMALMRGLQYSAQSAYLPLELLK